MSKDLGRKISEYHVILAELREALTNVEIVSPGTGPRWCWTKCGDLFFHIGRENGLLLHLPGRPDDSPETYCWVPETFSGTLHWEGNRDLESVSLIDICRAYVQMSERLSEKLTELSLRKVM